VKGYNDVLKIRGCELRGNILTLYHTAGEVLG